jgi:ribonuclease R
MGTTNPEAAALEVAVLKLLRAPGYRPSKPRQIAKQLGVADTEVGNVRRAVKRLVRRGELIFEAKHRVRAAPPAVSPAAAQEPAAGELPAARPPKKKLHAKGQVSGVFHRAQGGYGFVRLVRPATDPARPAGVEEVPDVFIPAKYTGDAANGDTVLVQLQRPKRDKGDKRQLGPAGEIVEVIQRETHDFVGTYFESDGGGYVQVDGTIFAQPISVGDPGAKGVQPDDKVVIEMIRFPSAQHGGEGVIVEVLGARGKPGIDTLSIMREFHLPERFPDDVLAEARLAAERFQEGETLPEGRLDLSGEVTVTIDPIDARDFDDAISLVLLENGNWRLGVHIADVSHFVRPRTPLDREARQRATSVYLPDQVVPMLPEIISNGLASLQPGKVRYTKTAFLEFSPEGMRTDIELRNSAIRSNKRLTYEEVDAYLADPAAAKDKLGAPVCGLLARMHKLAMTLRRRRFERGALELSLREVKVKLDPQGEVAGAAVVVNTESHQIIEEFMLAANEAVAEKIRDAGFPFLRRIHRPPNERKVRALQEFVSEMGIPVGSLESRFALQELLDKVAGRPEQQAVNFALLRSLQRAVYSPADEGHFALASTCYCHFTSPIRRYPDLTIHRLFDALLAGHRPPQQAEELLLLGQHCSQQEQAAELAERELTNLKLLGYLSQRIGFEMDGIVTGVESFGLFVQGIDLPAEGLLPVASLSDDFYRFDRASHTLTGYRLKNSYRLGDPLRVAVASVSLERRQMELRLLERRSREEIRRGGRPGQAEGAGSPEGTPPAQGRAKKSARPAPARSRSVKSKKRSEDR